ncbi:MAG: glycosyltransferase family 4 protein [Thermomicrobiales bacterium]
MKVLAFCDVDWMEGSGGVERALSEIYPRLIAQTDADIRLITLASKQLPREEECDGVRLVRARRLPLESLTGAQVSASVDVWATALRTARRFQPDIIHAHTLFYHTSLVAAAVARRSRVPLLLTLHLGALDALPQPYRAMSQLYERTVGRTLLAAASRILCVSDDVRQHARALGAEDAKLVVVPNGVDTARFAPQPRIPDRMPTVLCVGRLIFNKGPHYLLEAAAALHARGIPLRLVFAGDGPLEQTLRQQAARLNLQDVVEFRGRCDNVAALLGKADIFVRPSLTEGMSLAVLEAMAAGLPVIASDVSGTRQMIRDAIDGIITAPGSVSDLTRALARLLPDAELRARLGANARERALRYDWASVAAMTAIEMAHAARDTGVGRGRARAVPVRTGEEIAHASS